MSTQTREPRDRRGGFRTRIGAALSDQDLADVLGVIDSAQRLLSWTAMPGLDQVHDFASATAALNEAWAVISEALSGNHAAGHDIEACAELNELLVKVCQSTDLVRRAESAYQTAALRTVRQALARFHAITSVTELVEAAPATVSSLGFDRAIISRLHESIWVSEAAYIDGNAEWAAEVAHVGQAQPQRVRSPMWEAEMVRRRAGILVTNVQHDRRVHRPIADASQSRSYVAAPIMPGTEVIGFLHADRYFHTGDVDEFDRDILTVFAEGFGYALGRAALLNRLDTMRAEVHQLLNGISATVDEVTLPALQPGPHGRGANPGTPPVRAPLPAYSDETGTDSQLTRREIDVLRLMSGGHTNAQIANRLIISEGTVKSHVKHILRKLGAANRAEAVSRWLSAEPPRPST
jgi:DNA-binding CsgD family transcriptional regulator